MAKTTKKTTKKVAKKTTEKEEIDIELSIQFFKNGGIKVNSSTANTLERIGLLEVTKYAIIQSQSK